MSLPPNLFWQHLTGDAKTVPCVHIVPQHPNGDTIFLPCTHAPVQQHPQGDTISVTVLGHTKTKTVPCIHWVPPHPQGDPHTVPCVHLTAQHPGGDTVFVPCVHPMVPVSLEFSGNLIFYTNNSQLRDAAIFGVSRLQAMGVNITAPRPLNIFNHDWDGGSPHDSSNPAWSHYDPLTHSIQITADRTGTDLRETVHHEMGHALIGHRCGQILTLGGSHSLTAVSKNPVTGAPDPGLALSEGWANFVGLAIENSDPSNAGPISFKGLEWENMSISPDPTVEYCVGCCLWDLCDSPVRTLRGPSGSTAVISFTEGGTDVVALPFVELYRVYSPSLKTLRDGPIILNIGDYMERLKQNNPSLAAKIDAVRVHNVG